MTKIVDDPFTEASDTDLDAHTPNTAGTGWTLDEQTGTEKLIVVAADDECSPGGLENTDRLLYSSQPNPSDSSTTEYDVSFILKGIRDLDDAPFGMFARFADTNNYYSGMVIAPSGIDHKRLYKKVAGVSTELARGGNLGKPDVNDQIIFKLRDSTDRLTLRNDTDAHEITSDDSALSSAGKCGLCVGNVQISTEDIQSDWDVDDYYWDDLNGAPAGFAYSQTVII